MSDDPKQPTRDGLGDIAAMRRRVQDSQREQRNRASEAVLPWNAKQVKRDVAAQCAGLAPGQVQPIFIDGRAQKVGTSDDVSKIMTFKIGKEGMTLAGARETARRTAFLFQHLQKDYGLTKNQAAGVIGNLAIESGFFQKYHEGSQKDGQGGYGWVQWTEKTRRRRFFAFARQNHLDPSIR